MSGTAYRTVDPEDASRAIRMFCSKCWHRWPVSVPEQNAESFFLALRCRCGAGNLKINSGDAMRLRELVDGTHVVV